MKILIVDDDKIFLDKMRKLLTIDNHTVLTAISGEEALKTMKKNSFDLILTDLKMPGLSGIEFLKKIREIGVDSIVIMITGYGTIESAVEAMREGAYDYILKPFNISTIKNKIKQVELDLNLRKSITLPKILKKSEFVQSPELLDINGYKSPFLLISDEDPQNFIKKFNLTNVIPIYIDNNKGNTITLIPFYSLKNKIKEFMQQNKTGTIILKGIEEFSKLYNWETLKQFFTYLISEILTSDFSLIILLPGEIDFLNNLHHKALNDSLSLFVNPIFNKIINLLSHPLRKNIISLLRSEPNLNFNKIVKKLNVKRSSVLAFHINKLIEESILEKDGNLYILSPIGLHFINIITELEKFGFTYPDAQIKVFKIPNNS